MSVKAILVFCAQAFFIQSALSQCTSRAAVAADPRLMAPMGLASPYGLDGPYGFVGSALAAPYGLTAPALAAPYGMCAPCGWAAPALDFTPTSGGALPVTSGSAIPPVGISIVSENVYEGILAAAGEVPFVGTVAVEGVLPTTGAGAINHACGNGINAMVSETTAFAPGYAATGIAPGIIAPGLAAPALAYSAGWDGRSYGCAL